MKVEQLDLKDREEFGRIVNILLAENCIYPVSYTHLDDGCQGGAFLHDDPGSGWFFQHQQAVQSPV